MGRMDFCRMISIHAPTRGATGILLIPAYKHSIFQSTLLQEERRFLMQCRSKTKHFNPRSCKRSDDPEFDLFSPKFEISIHAPTRGATSRFFNAASRFSNFNPRSYKRSDDKPWICKLLARFISIHAPTRGATKKSLLLCYLVTISIHAPTRGATDNHRW